MSNYNFNALLQQYPGVIAQMKDVFDAHAFILSLAQGNQQLYIQALNACPNAEPFRTVHSQLAKLLYQFPNLVKYIGDTTSLNIFGIDSKCSKWEKI